MKLALTFSEIEKARERLRPHLLTTPLEHAPSLNDSVYFKLENVNILHSFKIRGALNAILAQEAQAIVQGVVTASAGNHGMGVVYVARHIGVKAQVVMPRHASQRKINGVRRYGAEVILHGEIYDDAEAYARQLEKSTGALYISAYNDPLVSAGQGTIALEILEQLPSVTQILVPVGGGGLMAGIGVAVKALHPEIRLIGVQSEATPAMYNFLRGTTLPQRDTLADGLSGDIEADSITLDLAKTVIDDLLLVSEADIAQAIGWMLREHGWVIEGSAAVGIAAYLSGKLPLPSSPTVILITGGNIDVQKFLQIV